MGNINTTIGNVNPDLPPDLTTTLSSTSARLTRHQQQQQSSSSSSSEKEEALLIEKRNEAYERFYTTFDQLHKQQNPGCQNMIQLQHELLNDKSRNWTSEQTTQIQSLTSACFLFHLDRSFYDCLQQPPAAASSPLSQGAHNAEILEKLMLVIKHDRHSPVSQQVQSEVNQCLKLAQPVREEMNRVLNDREMRRESLSRYEKIAQRSKLQIEKMDTPQDIQRKAQLTMEDTCMEYYANSYLKTGDNNLRHTFYNCQFNRCMIAELCAQQLLSCLRESDGKNVLECYQTSALKSCYKKFRRRGDMDELFSTDERHGRTFHSSSERDTTNTASATKDNDK